MTEGRDLALKKERKKGRKGGWREGEKRRQIGRRKKQ